MKSLRASFLVTVAASALAAPACDDSVTTVNPPGPGLECPTSTPASGAACGSEGLQCIFGECSETQATCVGGVWVVNISSSCNPPPPCPAELPASGEPCSATPGGFPSGCTYAANTPCGEQQAAAECQQNANMEFVWSVTLPDDCSGADCAAYDDSGICQSDTGCRWLVPGCGEECATCPPPVAEGCYPVDDCDANSCGAGEACQTVVQDPCWDSLCNACGGETDVCVAL